MTAETEAMLAKLLQWWSDEKNGIKHPYEDTEAPEVVAFIREYNYKMRDVVVAELVKSPKVPFKDPTT